MRNAEDPNPEQAFTTPIEPQEHKPGIPQRTTQNKLAFQVLSVPLK